MRILIDLCHPADVFLFKEIDNILKLKDIETTYTSRPKDVLAPLCKKLNLECTEIGSYNKGIIGKSFQLISRSLKLSKIIKSKKIKLIIGFGNPYSVLAAKLTGIKGFYITDTENVIANYIGLISDDLLIPSWLNFKRYNNINSSPWFKEMAYTKPGSAINSKTRPYVLIRKVAWTAVHDYNQKGLGDYENIEALKNYKTIVIDERKHRIKNPQLFHSLLKNAELVISEGATTAAESALMGKKTIYINSQIPYSTKKLEELGLLEIAVNHAEFERKMNYLRSKESGKTDWKIIETKYVNPAREAAKIILKLVDK